MRWLLRTQWLDAKEIRVLQLKKLRAMLEHCYRTVPYYHRAMREVGLRPEEVRSVHDLRHLPPVGKAEIRKKPVMFRSLDRQLYVQEVSTSGSTGEPFKFLRSWRSTVCEFAGLQRTRGWTGYRLGDRWVMMDIGRPIRSLRRRLMRAAGDAYERRMTVDGFQLTGEVMKRAIQRIVTFKPFLVQGGPKSLLEFGRFAEAEGVHIPALISSRERIPPFERRLVAKRWGGEVYDRYSSMEALAISSECNEHQGLHVADELYVLEFMRDGEHVSPGEHGRVLVTSLCHDVQPFIRYDLGDISGPIEEDCRCGRGLSLMSAVEGRRWDVLETEDGELIYGMRADWVEDDKVRQWQIEQLSRTKTIVRIVPDEGYTEESSEAIAARARGELGTGVEVEIRLVDVIPDYESGKRQPVKSNVRFPSVT